MTLKKICRRYFSALRRQINEIVLPLFIVLCIAVPNPSTSHSLAQAATVPGVSWASPAYHVAMKVPGKLLDLVKGIGRAGVIKAIEYTDEAIRFYTAVAVMQYAQCAYSGDAIPCRSFLESMKDPYHIMGFYVFVLTSRGVSTGLKFLTSKGRFTWTKHGLFGHLPMAAGMFADHIFSDTVHHESWSRYQMASLIEDDRLREAERSKALREVYGTFLKQSWWEDQAPNLAGMVLAAMGSGYFMNRVMPTATHALYRQGRIAEILLRRKHGAKIGSWSVKMARLAKSAGAKTFQTLVNSRSFELSKIKFFFVNGKFLAWNWVFTFALAIASTDVFLWLVEEISAPAREWWEGHGALKELTAKIMELQSYLISLKGQDPAQWHPARKKAIAQLMNEVHYSWKIYRNLIMTPVHQQQMLVNQELGVLADQMIKMQNFYQWIARGMNRQDSRYISNHMGWHDEDPIYNSDEHLNQQLTKAGLTSAQCGDMLCSEVEEEFSEPQSKKIEVKSADSALKYDLAEIQRSEARVLNLLFACDAEIAKSQPDLELLISMGERMDLALRDYIRAGGTDLLLPSYDRDISARFQRVKAFFKDKIPQLKDPVQLSLIQQLKNIFGVDHQEQALSKQDQEVNVSQKDISEDELLTEKLLLQTDQESGPLTRFDSQEMKKYPDVLTVQAQSYFRLRGFFCGRSPEESFTPSQDWGGIPMRTIKVNDWLEIPYWPFGTQAQLENFRVFNGLNIRVCDDFFLRAHKNRVPMEMAVTPRQFDMFYAQLYPAADQMRLQVLDEFRRRGEPLGQRVDQAMARAHVLTDGFRTELMTWHEEALSDKVIVGLTGMDPDDVRSRYELHQRQEAGNEQSILERRKAIDDEEVALTRKFEEGEISQEELFEKGKAFAKERRELEKLRVEWRMLFDGQNQPSFGIHIFGWNLIGGPDLSQPIAEKEISEAHHFTVLGSIQQEKQFWHAINALIPQDLREKIQKTVEEDEMTHYQLLRYTLSPLDGRQHRRASPDLPRSQQNILEDAERMKETEASIRELNKVFRWE